MVVTIQSIRFFCATLIEFFARTCPPSSSRKPFCIPKTRIVATTIHRVFIESLACTANKSSANFDYIVLYNGVFTQNLLNNMISLKECNELMVRMQVDANFLFEGGACLESSEIQVHDRL